MNFQFSVKPSTEYQENEISALKTNMELVLSREELINSFENDKDQCCVEIRQMLYMYHYAFGYVTQMTDDSIYHIYDYLTVTPEYNEVVFVVQESEKIYNSDSNKRSHNVQIDVVYR